MPWKIQQTSEDEIQFRIPLRFHLPTDMGEPIPTHVFTSIYFDTKQHRLGQLGLILRKRVEGSHAVWQLKIPSGAVRLELEIDSRSRTIPSEFQDLLLGFFRKHAAVQFGKLQTKRTGIRIQKDNQGNAEILQDSVALLRDKKVIHTFHELEVKFPKGAATHLKPIRKILNHAGAQEKSFQPKIFQALQLPYPVLLECNDPAASPTEHIRKRLHAQYFQMLRHDPSTRLGRDSEALHQMRVTTRRIRAILRTVRPFLEPEWVKHIRKELGWIGSLLGENRDYDVLLEYFRQNFNESSSGEQRAFQSILNTFEGRRAIVRAGLLEGLCSDRYLNLLNDLEDSLTHLPFQPSSFTIVDLAKRAFHKLQAFVNSSDGHFPKPELHRTRILLKRARYALELAEPLLGQRATRFIQEAKHAQDLLGQHQDAVVAEQQLLSLKQHSRRTGIAYVTGLMVERVRNQQVQVYQQIPEQWKKLKKRGKRL